jgi:TATA-box binding protein (TBP) (component of TFIID and TFIIIB)
MSRNAPLRKSEQEHNENQCVLNRIDCSREGRTDHQFTNTSAAINCNLPLRLEALAQHPNHRPFETYNPELSAGAIYKIPEPKVTLVICESGKVS